MGYFAQPCRSASPAWRIETLRASTSKCVVSSSSPLLDSPAPAGGRIGSCRIRLRSGGAFAQQTPDSICPPGSGGEIVPEYAIRQPKFRLSLAGLTTPLVLVG